VFLVFFAAALTFINDERRVWRSAYFIVIFGVVMAFAGILMKLSNLEGIYGVRETPQAISFGPFVNQHHFAAFMQMTGGMTLGLMLDRTKGREKKVLLAAALIVMGVAVVWTSSRGGMLGFVSMLTVAMLLSIVARRNSGDEKEARTRPIAMAAAGGALLFVIFGSALFLGGNDQLLRATGAVRADVDISTGRFHFWPIAVSIFLERPLFGAGLDAFGVAFTKYDTWSGFFRVEQAHNEYLQILADAGVAGFLCVAAFVFLLVRNGIRAIGEAHGFRRGAAIGALAGCFGILVHGFFDFPLRTYSNGFFFLLLATIATVRIASSGARHAGRVNAHER
jgi:O-antigen ligase